MVAQPKSIIKSYFETGDQPSQAQFVDLIDSYQDVGAGGAVTGPVSSLDSQIALFSGTTGGVIKAATVTGILKAASGVITTASSGTDYAPPTSGSAFLKGNGSGGFTNQTSINLIDLATQGSNTVLAEATGSTASPTAVALSTQQVLGRLGGNITGVTIGTGANNLVQLDGSSKLPAVDGSQLTNLPASYVFLGSQTASTSPSLPFTSKITSTYDNYVFFFKDIRPATNSKAFRMFYSFDNAANYNASANVTSLVTGIALDGTSTTLANEATAAAAYFNLTYAAGVGSGATEALQGQLTLFNPLGTNTSKRVSGSMSYHGSGAGTPLMYQAYGSTTSSITTAVNAVKFQMETGNLTSGTIYMYGIKNS